MIDKDRMYECEVELRVDCGTIKGRTVDECKKEFERRVAKLSLADYKKAKVSPHWRRLW